MSGSAPRIIKILANIPLNLLLFSVLIIPFLIMIYLSFLNWNPASGLDWWKAPFYGIENFVKAFSDQRFTSSLLRTILYVAISVSLEFILGLALAYVLLGKVKGKKIAISIIIYPLMLPPVIVGAIFYLMFQSYGPVNNLFLKAFLGERALGIQWFLDPQLAFSSLIIADVWQWTPFMFLIMYSALSAVPKRLIEAAEILGASSTTIFWRIRLPLVKPLIIVALVLRSLEAFKVFDYVYVMTGGGPGTSSETVSLYIYRVAIEYHSISYAAAMSLIVLLLIIVVSRLFIWYAFERGER